VCGPLFDEDFSQEGEPAVDRDRIQQGKEGEDAQAEDRGREPPPVAQGPVACEHGDDGEDTE
jgi:hypothetical protein